MTESSGVFDFHSGFERADNLRSPSVGKEFYREHERLRVSGNDGIRPREFPLAVFHGKGDVLSRFESEILCLETYFGGIRRKERNGFYRSFVENRPGVVGFVHFDNVNGAEAFGFEDFLRVREVLAVDYFRGGIDFEYRRTNGFAVPARDAPR